MWRKKNSFGRKNLSYVSLRVYGFSQLGQLRVDTCKVTVWGGHLAVIIGELYRWHFLIGWPSWNKGIIEVDEASDSSKKRPRGAT